MANSDISSGGPLRQHELAACMLVYMIGCSAVKRSRDSKRVGITYLEQQRFQEVIVL